MHPRHPLQIALCLFLSAANAFAQAASGESDGSPIDLLTSIDVGAPLLASVSGAAAFSLSGDFSRGHHGLIGDAFVVSLQAGIAGAKVTAGLSRFSDGAAFHVNAVALRTWKNALLTPENTSHVGIELAVRAMAVRFTVGPLYSVSGQPGDWSAVATVGLGY
jgi:hypothetical protein